MSSSDTLEKKLYHQPTWVKESGVYEITIPAVGKLIDATADRGRGTQASIISLTPAMRESLVAHTSNSLNGARNLQSWTMPVEMNKRCKSVHENWSFRIPADSARSLQAMPAGQRRAGSEAKTESYNLSTRIYDAYKMGGAESEGYMGDGDDRYLLHLTRCRSGNRYTFPKGTTKTTVNKEKNTFTFECPNTIISSSGDTRPFVDAADPKQIEQKTMIMKWALADLQLGRIRKPELKKQDTDEIARRLTSHTVDPTFAYWNWGSPENELQTKKEDIETALNGFTCKIVLGAGMPDLMSQASPTTSSGKMEIDSELYQPSADQLSPVTGKAVTLELRPETKTATGTEYAHATLRLRKAYAESLHQDALTLCDNAVASINMYSSEYGTSSLDQAAVQDDIADAIYKSIGRTEAFITRNMTDDEKKQGTLYRSRSVSPAVSSTKTIEGYGRLTLAFGDAGDE